MNERIIKLFRRHVVEEQLGSIGRNLLEKMPPDEAFDCAFAMCLCNHSCYRRIGEGSEDLLAETARSLFHQEFVAFLHRNHLSSYGPQWLADYEAAFVASCEADIKRIGASVEVFLDEECIGLFGASYDGSQVHPMFYLQRYLDELEHRKDTHPDEYKAEFRRKAFVTAMYRAGLAVLPRHTWELRPARRSAALSVAR